ncbi:MAG TPA: SGNH/GDSL hydrolase family protein [Dehalococcoidia bacterium]|nr:SGNH/GDSL hydrolase family protein [Dehalococcoidia bacterium]
MTFRLLPRLAAPLLLVPASLGSAHAAQAADAPAYLALGDSLAFGVGAQNPAAEGYVPLTHEALLLNDRFADSGLDLINISEPGATSGDLLEEEGQLEQALAEIETRRESPEDDSIEIISIDIGGNDLLSLAEPDSPCFEDPGGAICRTTINGVLGDMQSNLTTVLTSLREAAPRAEVYVLDVYNPYAGTGESLEVVAGIGVQLVNGVITAVASQDELETRLVGIHDLFEGRGQFWVAGDGIHPNNDGHRVLAEALTAHIEGRPIVLPADIATPPPATPIPVENSGDDGLGMTAVMLIAVGAFLAGGFVSASYFVVRGRS